MPQTTRSAVLLLVASRCCCSSLAAISDLTTNDSLFPVTASPLDNDDVVVVKLLRASDTLAYSFSLQHVSPYVVLFRLGHIGNLWAEVHAESERHGRAIFVTVRVETDLALEGEKYDRWDAVFGDDADKDSAFLHVPERIRASSRPTTSTESRQKGSCRLEAQFFVTEFQSANTTYWFEPLDETREWTVEKLFPLQCWSLQPSPSGPNSSNRSRVKAEEVGNDLDQLCGGGDSCADTSLLIDVGTVVHWSVDVSWAEGLQPGVEQKRQEALELKRRRFGVQRPLEPGHVPSHPTPLQPQAAARAKDVGGVVHVVFCCLCLFCCVCVCVCYLCCGLGARRPRIGRGGHVGAGKVGIAVLAMELESSGG